MENPLISIIVPIYNSEKYIKRCLDSIFNQDYTNFEVLCVDDGSFDGSASIIKQYNVKYFYQENMGQASARNKGIELSKGEWICFVDSDDSVEKNYLSSLVNGIKDDIGIVMCRIRRINENGKSSIDVVKKYGILNAKEALVTTNIGPTNKLIRKNIIRDCKFLEGKVRFEDILFTPELIINAKKINVIDDVLYNYYVRENSTMRLFDDSLNDIFIVLDKLKQKPFYIYYKNEIDYIIFKNGLFGHFSRIVYFDNKTIKNELDKASKYVLKNVPDYWNNVHIKEDKQPYFYIGVRLFKKNKLWILIKPLKLMEKGVNR